MTDRAVAPAIGKTLEIGFGVLVVALLTTALYGSVVPEYRTAAAGELGERALARAVTVVEEVVPPRAAYATATRRVELPGTIRRTTYEIHATGDALELRHPHPRVGGRIPLALPARVTVTGSWRSTDPFVVRATADAAGVTITVGGEP